MKIKFHLYALTALLLLLLVSCKDSTEYKISGKIEGLDVEYGTIYRPDTTTERGYRFDTVFFKNGKFSYSEQIEEPEVISVSFFPSGKLTKRIGRGFIPAKSAMLSFVALPGAKITVEGKASDFCDAYPSDDDENNILTELNSKVYPLTNESANLSIKAATDSTLSDDQRLALNKQGEVLSNEVIKIKLDFLEKNASSVAGLWLMEDMIIRSQIKIEKVAELLGKVDSGKYGNLSYYKAVNQRVDGYRKTGIGMTAPSISGINTIDETEFELSSLQGKYVILDFWGTWCHACLEGVPEMKKFREKHIEILEILGMAQDKSVAAVKECMKKNEMTWPNIMIGPGEQDYVAKYNVQGFPTKILLDREGKILLRSVGENDDFYYQAEELISGN